MSGIAGLAWYRAEQWELLRKHAVDKSNLELTYDEWHRIALEKLLELRARGVNVVPVNVDVHELLKWCKENNLPVNGASRSQYALKLAQEK